MCASSARPAMAARSTCATGLTPDEIELYFQNRSAEASTAAHVRSAILAGEVGADLVRRRSLVTSAETATPRRPRASRRSFHRRVDTSVLAAMLRLQSVTKRFGTVTAVDRIDLAIEQRRVLRAPRSERLRQDDHAAPHRRPRAAGRGQRRHRRTATSRRCRPIAVISAWCSRTSCCSRTRPRARTSCSPLRMQRHGAGRARRSSWPGR